jgi:hypothetical protein
MMANHSTVKPPRLSRVRVRNRMKLCKLELPTGGHGKLGTKQGDSVLAFTLSLSIRNVPEIPMTMRIQEGK